MAKKKAKKKTETKYGKITGNEDEKPLPISDLPVTPCPMPAMGPKPKTTAKTISDLEARVAVCEGRMDRIVEALSKSKSVKGL